MSSSVVLGIVVVAFAIAIVLGLMRRNRLAAGGVALGGDAPNTIAQWTEGETTRLLSSAELPRHEIFARIRLADVLQVKIGPQGMERLRAFRKIANQHVGFVICDRDMSIVAIVDAREPDQLINPRDQKLEIIKQRCLQAAQVKYVCVYPPQLPRYRELREQILGPAADLV